MYLAHRYGVELEGKYFKSEEWPLKIRTGLQI